MQIIEIGRCYSKINQSWFPVFRVTDEKEEFDQLYICDDDTLIDFDHDLFNRLEYTIDLDFHRWKEECHKSFGYY